MAYISLYRKYRPQTFEDVVGQEHVTTTLRNSISAGRIASGYLFTGTRGTAKTTCARIFAKALNCIGPDGSRTSPTPEPCGVCGPCKSVAASSFVDVLEMDAASHGKVDDVRDLVASIKFPPMEGRYKVYIIDEAHQLSRDAMDAFLKTLEEPPDRVVFILATTELDKLPITIASRCQVYEFKRGSVAQIGSRVSDVLKAEGVKADPAAVALIARAADGSYRDSLSLLEQVLAYQREHVTAQDVTVVLGTIGDDVLTQVVKLIADSDAAGAFALAGSILESGKDVRQFLKSLSERFRDLLFVGVGAHPGDTGEMDDTASLQAQSARFAPSALLHALETITAAEQETRRSSQHRLILELALLRLMELPTVAQFAAPVVPKAAAPPPILTTEPLVPVETAAPVPVAPVETAAPVPVAPMETAAPVPVAPVETAAPVPEIPVGALLAAPSPLALTLLSEPEQRAEPEQKAVAREEGAASSAPTVQIPYDIPPPLPDDEMPEEDSVDADLADEDDEVLLTAPVPGDEELDVLPFDDEIDDVRPSRVVVSEQQQDEDFMHVQQVAVEASPLLAPKPPPPADTPPELLRLQKSWQEVINLTGAKSKTAGKDVSESNPVSLTGAVFTLEFAHPFHFERVQSKEPLREFIAENICHTLAVPTGSYRVKCVLRGKIPPLPAALKADAAGSSVKPSAEAAQGSDAPGSLVQQVIAVFGGNILDDEREG